MAVYDRLYRTYTGRLTPGSSRFLVFARYALEDVFRSRLFLVFFVGCLVPILSFSVLIYLRYNLEALETFGIPVDQLLKIDAGFFRNYVHGVQSILLFVLILIVGPSLVSPDLRTNAMALYLSRPLSKRHYVAGKLLVLVLLGSVITWIPAVLLYVFNGFLAGGSWWLDNLRVPLAMVGTFGLWLLVLSMVALAISAWVKWRPIASIAFLALFFMASTTGPVMSAVMGTWFGMMLNPFRAISRIATQLYGAGEVIDFGGRGDMPVGAAWFSLGALGLVATWVLFRRIRAYEVVS